MHDAYEPCTLNPKKHFMVRYNSNEKKQLILDQLTWDTNIDPEQIDVQILNDEAILEGKVTSYQEKIAAEKTLQAIPGIRKILNNLAIELPPDSIKRTDGEVHGEVLGHLNKNEFLDTREVMVKVENSEVTFEGKVPSLKEKNLLTNIAYSTPGVVDVNNRTYVQPAEELTDEEIASDIRIELEERPHIDNDQIVVEVEDNVVHLRGSAPSWRAKEEIFEIASNTRSVTDVFDEIEVDQLPIDNEYRE